MHNFVIVPLSKVIAKEAKFREIKELKCNFKIFLGTG